jgi:hypothetical protein
MIQRHDAHMKTRRILPVLCAACLMAAFAAPVAASSPGDGEEPKRKASKTADTEAAAEPSIGAPERMKVIVDPETGEIIARRPRGRTEILSAPLSKALTRTTDGLQVFELSNGGKAVHLDGRFQHVIMVRGKPDGSFETLCTNHSHVAEKFLQGKSDGANLGPRDK